MTDEQAKLDLLPHSEAKVQLYGTYLSIYLNILSRVPSVHKIYLFDLLCGEGKYANGGLGSPLVTLEAIKNHYFANSNSCPNIEGWFNDNGKSGIEPDVTKIERVKRFSKEIFVPTNVRIRFFEDDYYVILQQALRIINQSRNAKGLFFIDPYGYKDVKPSHIKQILSNGNSEVLLFLPISFMYRFWNKAVVESFAGSDPLQSFIKELYGGTKVPVFNSVNELIEGLQHRFRTFFSEEEAFVAKFRIERDASNVYCLFFFTCNIRGFEKMMEAIWKLDSVGGQGFSPNQHPLLLSAAELQGYPPKLRNFLSSKPWKSNKKVYEFGLQEGFLPKHTTPYLSQWQKEGKLEVISLDGKNVRKNAFYLASGDRVVQFRLKE